MKGTTTITALAIFAGAAFPFTAKAVTLNGSFEDNFRNWETIGEYSIKTSAFGSEPIDESSQAFLSTAYNEVVGLDEDGNEIIGGDAVGVSFISGFPSLEEFLDLSTFFGEESLANIATAEPIEGSAIKQTFTAKAGQTLSFSWNFLTNELVGQAAVDDFTYPDYNDFAFASIQSDVSDELISFADTLSLFSSSSTTFDNETGFNTFSYTIPKTGTYTLGIGVVDVGEPTRISGLLIDKVEIAEAVPEPSFLVSFGCIASLGMISALKKAKS